MRIDISDQTVDALAELVCGGSANDPSPPVGLYRTGWRLEQWFKPFGIVPPIAGSSRYSGTREAIVSAISRNDGTIIRIIEKACDPRDFLDDIEGHNRVLEFLNRRLTFDGLLVEKMGNRVELTSLPSIPAAAEALAEIVATIDFDTTQRDLDRALKAADGDPEIAVTAACALIESVCRSILCELNIQLPAKQDIAGLYKAVREPLGLDPAKEGISPEVVSDVKAVLSGLITSIQSIGALRTHVGGAHGKEKGFRRIDSRIAKLAVHSASAIAIFLVETWQLRYPGRSLPKASVGTDQRAA